MVVEVKFFRQNTWFLKNNRTLSKFLYEILHYLISITKLSKKSVHVSQFYINHLSHFTVSLVSDKRDRGTWAPNFTIKLCETLI